MRRRLGHTLLLAFLGISLIVNYGEGKTNTVRPDGLQKEIDDALKG
jgi:hypothetical protein